MTVAAVVSFDFRKIVEWGRDWLGGSILQHASFYGSCNFGTNGIKLSKPLCYRRRHLLEHWVTRFLDKPLDKLQ